MYKETFFFFCGKNLATDLTNQTNHELTIRSFKRCKCNVVMLGAVVKGDPKAPFSIATTSRALLLSLDCSTLPLIRTLYCWVLSKDVSSTILKVSGMTLPGMEPRSPGPLANTLPTRPTSQSKRCDARWFSTFLLNTLKSEKYF